MILNFGDSGLDYICIGDCRLDYVLDYWIIHCGSWIGLCIGYGLDHVLDCALGIMDSIVYCICFVHSRWLLLLPFPLSISSHFISFHFWGFLWDRTIFKNYPKKSWTTLSTVPSSIAACAFPRVGVVKLEYLGVVFWLTELWSHDELKKTTQQPHRIHKCRVNVGKYSVRRMDLFGKKNK